MPRTCDLTLTYCTEAVEKEIAELKQRPEQQTSQPVLKPAQLDPTPSVGSESAHRHVVLDSQLDSDVVSDLRSLPLPLMHNLVELWFKDCQPWCPIIHRSHLQASLLELSYPVERIPDIVLRAVIALTVSYSSQAISLGYPGRQRLSRHLRSEVLSEALANVSLSSIQALLIIIILDYGSDEVPSSWSLLSVVRRMCEQTGLFRQLLAQIEFQTPTTIGPPSRDIFGGQDLTVPLTWVTLSTDSVWTLGAVWRDTSASLTENLASIAYLSTPDFSDSFRTVTHLGAMGLQPIHSLFWQQNQQRDTQTEAETLAMCDEIYQNLLTYTRLQVLPTYKILADGSIDFDPNAVLTSTLCAGAMVALYQPHIDLTVLSLAHQRCLDACEEMIKTLRAVSDADIEFNSPNLASNIFAVARFRLASYKASLQQREPRFDVLMHGLNMCGRRWTHARRLDIVARAAIIEVDAAVKGEIAITLNPKLPDEFWDLKKSAVDVYGPLRSWVVECEPRLYVWSLNNSYT